MTVAKVEEIARLIEEAVLSGELAPGTELPQRQLSEALGVSRTPVREALRQVAARGFLSLDGKRGARVRFPSHEELKEAYLVRAELEELAARLAAENITRAQLKALRAAERRVAQLTKSFRKATGEHELRGVTVDFGRANLEFHDLILDAAHAPYLKQVTQAVRLNSHVSWSNSPKLDQLYETAIAQHHGIVEAIAAKDLAVGELAKQHILDSLEVVEEMFANVLPPRWPLVGTIVPQRNQGRDRSRIHE
jgi:DNA-binding GntR family transcriptional regulator